MSSEKVPTVVGDKYVLANSVVLNTVKKAVSYCWTGDFIIRDENKQCLYKAHKSTRLKKSIYINDADNVPVVLLQKKLFKIGTKWKAYRGADTADLLFVCNKLNCTKYDVYLPGSSDGQPDFTITRNSWCSHDFKVFYGEQLVSSTTSENFKLVGKRKTYITVPAHVDQAFVAAILALMEEQIEELHQQLAASGGGGGSSS